MYNQLRKMIFQGIFFRQSSGKVHSKIQRVKFTPVKVKIYSLWESNNLWGRNYPISRVTITPLDDFDE